MSRAVSPNDGESDDPSGVNPRSLQHTTRQKIPVKRPLAGAAADTFLTSHNLQLPPPWYNAASGFENRAGEMQVRLTFTTLKCWQPQFRQALVG